MKGKRRNSPLRMVVTGLCAVAIVISLVPGASVWAKTMHKGDTGHIDTQAKDEAETTEDKVKAVSLVKLAPIVVHINRRYFKFFGDPVETVHGSMFERSEVTGDWNGGRENLTDAGVYFDVGVTQNLMSNVSGGIDTGTKYSGSVDLWLNLDTAQLTNAAWPGATIFFHGEKRWNDGILPKAGAAIPPTFDDTMPLATDYSNFYLSEYYLVQALSPKVSMWVGQMNGAGLVDGNAFANSEKHQFMNTALVDNPAVGAFAPYTAFTAAAIYMPNQKNVFIAGVMDSNGQVDKPVWSTYDTDATLLVASYAWLPEFDGLPGRYQILGAYTNKDTPNFAIDNRLDLARLLLGIDSANPKTDNYIALGTFDQYLYVKDEAQQIGWGLFARFAWDPKDRNVIDQFYSFGVGGRGCLIPGRDLDFWGLGWAGTHISADLRQDLEFLNVDVKSYEHVVEAFYNISLTPAIYLTLDAQYIINPLIAQLEQGTGGIVKSDDHAFVIGTRLQIDF